MTDCFISKDYSPKMYNLNEYFKNNLIFIITSINIKYLSF